MYLSSAAGFRYGEEAVGLSAPSSALPCRGSTRDEADAAQSLRKSRLLFESILSQCTFRATGEQTKRDCRPDRIRDPGRIAAPDGLPDALVAPRDLHTYDRGRRQPGEQTKTGAALVLSFAEQSRELRTIKAGGLRHDGHAQEALREV